MKKFLAFAIAFLFFILLTVPCFADKDDAPGPPDPKLHQVLKLDVVR